LNCLLALSFGLFLDMRFSFFENPQDIESVFQVTGHGYLDTKASDD